VLDFLGTRHRTHTCGQLRAADAGQTVTLMGWVNRRRDHGSLIFLDVRDRYGITQVVLDKDLAPEGHAKAEQARPEYVVCAAGKVRLRGTESVNPKMPTGEIEIAATELLLLNDAKVPPFSPAEEAIANEEVRLKYRYLDLRRPEMQRNFEIRHKVALAVREYLNSQGFYEIETPFMTRSTPEGARLPGAEPRQPRRILRLAAVAAALQADPHDFGARPILSDRPLLPRRGFAG
jgi:aspartyl-tRNA synthetase